MRNYGRFAYDASHNTFKPATQKQIEYIVSLLNKVYGVQTPTTRQYIGSVLQGQQRGTLTKQRASEMITNLKRMADNAEDAPVVASAERGVQAAAAQSVGLDLTVLRGRYYAVRDEEANKVRFFRVSIPTKADSKWLGWVFVDEQASDDFHRVGSQKPEQSYKGRYVELLRWVVEHEAEALALYGHEIGNCGVCGRTLTDELSRERGIGPICWEKMGY